MNITNGNQIGVSIFGASPDTSNQGVNALHDSLLSALANRGVGRSTVFGFSDAPAREISVGDKKMWVEQFAAFRTRRFYRRESFTRLNLAARLNVQWHAGARSLMTSQALLDISAGDSFTDLYGWKRFLSVLEPKLLALRLRKPLVLMPQTIGPFQSSRAIQLAQHVLKKADQVWVRDDESLELAEKLVCDDRKSAIRDGVDMAFLLQSKKPEKLPLRVKEWLDRSSPDHVPVLGLNVSGLIYNDFEQAKKEFGLRTDYRSLLKQFLQWCLRETPFRVLLIPHVLAKPGYRESDFAACQQLLRGVSVNGNSRVEILPAQYSAAELKWIIGGTDWFCGTRMHSTIAALSGGVPVTTLAYSMKAHGVFAKCGLSGEVLEMRSLSTEKAQQLLATSVLNKKLIGLRLNQALPNVLSKAHRQMDEIVQLIGRVPRDRKMRTSSSKPAVPLGTGLGGM